MARESAAGIRRVRSRVRERGEHSGFGKQRPPPTFINHVVSPGRRFATVTLALADVKETSKALGVTMNDVVLASAAGGATRVVIAP